MDTQTSHVARLVARIDHRADELKAQAARLPEGSAWDRLAVAGEIEAGCRLIEAEARSVRTDALIDLFTS